jgi:hypothetical protein
MVITHTSAAISPVFKALCTQNGGFSDKTITFALLVN